MTNTEHITTALRLVGLPTDTPIIGDPFPFPGHVYEVTGDNLHPFAWTPNVKIASVDTASGLPHRLYASLDTTTEHWFGTDDRGLFIGGSIPAHVELEDPTPTDNLAALRWTDEAGSQRLALIELWGNA